MTWRPTIVASTAAGIVLLFSQPGSAADSNQGAQIAAMCASCHRLDGGAKGIPTIVGLGEEKLAGALLAYRASEIPSQIMHAVALSLSDEEIASVAQYLAGQGK